LPAFIFSSVASTRKKKKKKKKKPKLVCRLNSFSFWLSYVSDMLFSNVKRGGFRDISCKNKRYAADKRDTEFIDKKSWRCTEKATFDTNVRLDTLGILVAGCW
jgi:hypothetical protein